MPLLSTFIATYCSLYVRVGQKTILHYTYTVPINHQPDATIFQFIILTFIYSSTCFGCSPAHHQELDCSSSLLFYLRIVVIAVLCSWSGRLTYYTHNLNFVQQISIRSFVYDIKYRSSYKLQLINNSLPYSVNSQGLGEKLRMELCFAGQGVTHLRQR